MEPTPNKRLTLEEWQDKEAIKFGFLAFSDLEDHGDDEDNYYVELQALRGFHAQEVAFLQSQIPQWVSVEERLPEDQKSVMVFYTSIQNPEHKSMRFGFLNPALSGFYIEHDEETGEIPLEKITHWMPLPQPPIK